MFKHVQLSLISVIYLLYLIIIEILYAHAYVWLFGEY